MEYKATDIWTILVSKGGVRKQNYIDQDQECWNRWWFAPASTQDSSGGEFLIACYPTLQVQPALLVRPSIHPSVRLSICHTLLFFCFRSFWPHCSCPNDLVISLTAPAHPHANEVAVCPALFSERISLLTQWCKTTGSLPNLSLFLSLSSCITLYILWFMM